MVDRRERKTSRTSRRTSRPSGSSVSRASSARRGAPKGSKKAAARKAVAKRPAARVSVGHKSAVDAPRKAQPKARRASNRARTQPETVKAVPVAPPPPSPAPVAAPSALGLASAALGTLSLAPEAGVLIVRRRRRGPRVKFTRWLYSENLYRQLGVSPRGQALVCRELRAERDGSWSARIAAVPQGFFESVWVPVPPEVVVPVARPKPASVTH